MDPEEELSDDLLATLLRDDDAVAAGNDSDGEGDPGRYTGGPIPMDEGADDEDDADALLAAAQALPTEKGRLKAVAAVCASLPSPSSPPPPPSSSPLVTYPHDDDLRRLSLYAYAMVASMAITGTMGKIGEAEEHMGADKEAMEGAILFYLRFNKMRSQVSEALEARFRGVPAMGEIVSVLPRCKLVQAVGKTEVEAGSPARCVWTGRPVAGAAKVYAMSLHPISRSWSHTGNERDELTPASEGVVFYALHPYANLIRAMHTVLFFLDHLQAKLEGIVTTTRKGGMGTKSGAEWERDFWRSLFDPAGDKKLAPLAHEVASCGQAFRCCCRALAALVGNEAFVVITTPDEK